MKKCPRCGRKLDAEGFCDFCTKDICKKLEETGKRWIDSLKRKVS